MKLHFSPRSPYVRKVMACAIELGLVDRLEKVRSPVAMTEPNLVLMRDNPLGRLPTLVTDEGMVLFDSIVICEYLDGLAGGKLFPAAGPGRIQALRWHALGDGMLDTGILWRNERDKPAVRQTPEWLGNFELKMRNALDFLEGEAAALEKAPVGIGHVTLGCALGYLDFRFQDIHWRESRPAITGWYASFAERASMKDTQPALA
ncbi:MAG: glutathione S-transferase [Betaproteobacteria bacterium]